MDEMTFWTNTNKLIRERNSTQKALALQCGFSQRRIESLSSSKRLPDVIEGVKIATALDTTVEFLVTGKSHDAELNSLEEKNLIMQYRLLTKEQQAGIIALANAYTAGNEANGELEAQKKKSAI